MTHSIVKKNIARVLGYSRLGLYTLESLPLIYSRRQFGLTSQPDPSPPSHHLQILHNTIGDLIEEELRNLQDEIYSIDLLIPENPIRHMTRYIKIFGDNINAALRKKNNIHKSFSENVSPLLSELPDYYKRNFHNQTDGYLSDNSAELYSHQTEILFKGSLALMRRILLADLIKHIRSLSTPPQILEIGCGIGDSTEILLKSCPNIELTAVDLSKPYLNKAEKSFEKYKNIQFMNKNAESLNIEGKFDIIFSSFLFHEVPLQVRNSILESTSKHLRIGGLMCHIDSLQLGDQPHFDWALIQFPKDFHEPFYKSYVSNLLEESLPQNFSLQKVRQAFLAKAVFAKKMAN